MYTATAARARFVDQSVETASPSRLVTLLYDRLCLDLARAERAQRSGDRSTAHQQLLHAQDIISALQQGLDSTWAGAAGLSALYGFLLTELVDANVSGDADKTASCSRLLEPLRDAWHEASRAAAADGAPRATTLSFTA